MKKILLLIFLPFYLTAVGQTFSWVKQFKNPVNDNNEKILKFKKDHEGNFYFLVTCENYVDPTVEGDAYSVLIGSDHSIEQGSVGKGLIIIKLNKNGDYQWFKFFNNVIENTADFDLYNTQIYVSFSQYSRTANTWYPISKVAVLSQSGVVIKQKEIANQESYGFALDASGNMAIVLSLASSRLEFSDTDNESYNYYESSLASVLVWLNNDFKVQWTKRIGNTSFNSQMSFDQSQDLYFAANETYDGGYILEKYKGDGAVIYSYRFNNQNISTLAVDHSNNLVVAASPFCDGINIIDVDPSPDQHLITCGLKNPFFILWLNSDGTFMDVREFIQEDSMVEADVHHLFFDSKNNLHLSGSFGSPAHNARLDTDPGPGGRFLVRQSGHVDGFSIELDENRNFKKSFKLGSYDNIKPAYGTAIDAMAEDDTSFYYVGGFSWNANFNPKGDPPYYLNSINNHVINTDGYFLRLTKCQTNPRVSANTGVCPGHAINLQASGGTSYYWAGPNGFTSTQQNPVIPNATAAHAGTYNCVISGTGDCDGTYSVIVQVEDTAAPVPDLPQLPAITGNCKTVIATVPTATDACAGNIIATTSDPLRYSLPGEYVIIWKYDDGNGNIATQQQNVIITSEPPPTATANQIFCKIDNPTIAHIAITGTVIKWYDATGNILDQNTALIDRTSYFATQTVDGCESAKLEITVTVSDPAPPAGNAEQEFCAAQNPTVANLQATGQNLIWYNTAGSIFSPDTPLVDGQVYFGTQTVNGCESSRNLAVKVAVTDGGIPATNADVNLCSDNLRGNKIVNLNEYKNNLISNTEGLIFEFFDVSNQPILHPSNTAIPVGTTVFNVKISNSLGCFVQKTLSLILNPKPELVIDTAKEFCLGQSAELDAGEGFAAYIWTLKGSPAPLSTSQYLTVTKAGIYTIEVKNIFGCSSNSDVVVSYAAQPSIIRVDVSNNTARVVLSENGSFLYSLDNRTWQTNDTFSGLSNGNYTAYVKTSGDCIIGQINFSLFNISNSFTPNADGINDTWKIDGIENYPGSEVHVYDRYGNKVFFKIVNNNFEWDGTFGGRPLPTASYWYSIKISDGRQFTGWLHLTNR